MTQKIDNLTTYLLQRPKAKKILDALLIQTRYQKDKTSYYITNYKLARESGISQPSVTEIISELNSKFRLIESDPVVLARKDQTEGAKKKIKSGSRLKNDVQTFSLLAAAYGNGGSMSEGLSNFMRSQYASVLLDDDFKLPFLLLFSRMSHASFESKQLVEMFNEMVIKDGPEKLAGILAYVLNEVANVMAEDNPEWAKELAAMKKKMPILKGERPLFDNGTFQAGIERFLKEVDLPKELVEIMETFQAIPDNAKQALIKEQDGEVIIIEDGEEFNGVVLNSPSGSRAADERVHIAINDLRNTLVELFAPKENWTDYVWILKHSPSAFAALCIPSVGGRDKGIDRSPVIYNNKTNNKLSRNLKGKISFSQEFRDSIFRYRAGILSIMYHSLAYDVLNKNLILPPEGNQREQEIKTLNSILEIFNGLHIITDLDEQKEILFPHLRQKRKAIQLR